MCRCRGWPSTRSLSASTARQCTSLEASPNLALLRCRDCHRINTGVVYNYRPTLVKNYALRYSQDSGLVLPMPRDGAIMLIYHCTTEAAARQILVMGFSDQTGRYLTDREWSGVWLSDRPLHNTEGASGDTV